jgi:hypothetical protein
VKDGAPMNNSVTKTIVRELHHMLPPTVFFGIGFNALVLTIDTLSEHSGGQPISHLTASIGALLVAKGVIVAEMLPFFNKFQSEPRVVSVSWKAGLYFLLTTLLHITERAFSASRNAKGLEAGVALDFQAFDWSHFWLTQLWLAILIYAYTSLMVFVRELGHESVYQAYFGQRKST